MAGIWSDERKSDKKAKKDAKVKDQQRQSVIRNLMSTIAGRAFVCDILSGCHTFASSFSLNGLQMAFNEGERNQGLKLLRDIMQACPDYYTVMMKEYNERSTDDSNRASSDGSPSGGEYGGGEDADRGDQAGSQHDAPDPHGYYS